MSCGLDSLVKNLTGNGTDDSRIVHTKNRFQEKTPLCLRKGVYHTTTWTSRAVIGNSTASQKRGSTVNLTIGIFQMRITPPLKNLERIWNENHEGLPRSVFRIRCVVTCRCV